MSDKKEILLRINGISTSFAGTKVLDNINIDICKGEIHALLGENGAAKSTLIKILSGIYKADEGSLIYRGKNIGMDVNRLSLSVIHQDLGLVEGMSVLENIALTTKYCRNKCGLISWNETRKKAVDILKKMDVHIDPDSDVALLSSAEKSMVAISRALANDCDILILDEPTATLPEKDVDRLFEMMCRLKEHGIALIFVTNRLDEVFRISDKITVLRNGKLIKSEFASDLTSEQLVFDIVGKEVADISVEERNFSDSEILLEVKNLISGFVGPVSFELHKGEVLGLFGLRGAGHHELGRCIWGVEEYNGGQIRILGKNYIPSDAMTAINAGFGFVSSKRLEEGLAASLSVRENMYINPMVNHGKFWQILHEKTEKRQCDKVIDKFSIRPNDSERSVGTLSGGNQQKICVARWFEANCDVLILEEPTIGVDVGAKADIYLLIKQMLGEGKGVVLISSDYEEVCRISHRALVFDKGQVVGEVLRSEMTGAVLSGIASGAMSVSNGKQIGRGVRT